MNKQSEFELFACPGFAGSEPFELEARLLGKDGIHRWFLGRHNPFVEEGRVRRWYVTVTEIESRKQEEERGREENVRLEERTRIAQELHDTLLQTFQSALLHLGSALDGITQDSPFKPQLDRTLQIMRQGIEEGRNAIQGLRSSGSQTSDLVVALSRIQEELEEPPNIDFRVIVTGRQRQLPREIQDEIYRIGREALVNAFCHSGAKRVELELEYSDSDLRMRIRDNGCGVNPQVLEKGRDGHWGLAGMRERATRIGGLVKILSSPMAGTEVQLSIPSNVAFHPAIGSHCMRETPNSIHEGAEFGYVRRNCPVPGTQRIRGHPKENFRNEQIAYTYKHGIDNREDGGGRIRANPGVGKCQLDSAGKQLRREQTGNPAESVKAKLSPLVSNVGGKKA